MKNIHFIGAFDKLDLILYVAKTLKMLGNKVLIVDATQIEKSKYIVPSINPTRTYLTQFDEMDVAVGFNSFQEIEEYMITVENRRMEYDYVLTDIERQEAFVNFYNQDTVKTYFVTSLEAYSIRRGVETIGQIQQPVPMKRILFSSNPKQDDIHYIEFLSLGYRVAWEDEVINFPYDTQDLEVMMDNEKSHRISIKNLSPQYKDQLQYLIVDIIPDINLNDLRRVMKIMEKEG